MSFGTMNGRRPTDGLNVVALVNKSERYVFVYDDDSYEKTLQTMGKYAADPELNFSWYDAAVLSQKARKMRDKGSEPV